MRKSSTQSAEARQKMTASHYRRYAAKGGRQTEETKQKISATQKRRFAEIARKVAFAEAMMSRQEKSPTIKRLTWG